MLKVTRGTRVIMLEECRPSRSPSAAVRAGSDTVVDVIRQCSRTGCTEAAVACMGYQYAQRGAWIDGLGEERDPHAYDLCERHAARLSVPAGWELDDRRAHRADTVATRLAG